jgi:hypothetical protein
MCMNTDPKIMLSDDELQLVTNTGWILTKRRVMEKVDLMLGYVAADQKKIIENEMGWLPGEVVRSEPKIARGENYLQLPYLMLDHPRCFDAENIFAIRTMFWWGNFFSVTLHLSGKYKETFQQKIIDNIGSIKQDVFICINDNQWQHHFEADNYIPVKQLAGAGVAENIFEKQFIKLAIKFPLQPWVVLTALLDDAFLEMIKLLKS